MNTENKNINLPTEPIKTVHRVGERVLSRKKFGEKFGIKGAELRRKHYEYLLANPLSDMVQGVSWTRVTRNPKTGHVTASGYDAAAMAKKAPKSPKAPKKKAEVISLADALAAIQAAAKAGNEQAIAALEAVVAGQ